MAGSNIASINRGLPPLSHNKQVYGRAADIINYRWVGPCRAGMGRAESLLADLDAFLPKVQEGLEELKALERPALQVEIAKELIALIGCFPSGNVDPEIFGRLLIERVAATQPSIADVEAACSYLLDTHIGFCPSIAEVLAALKATKQHREALANRMVEIINSRDQRVKDVERENQRHREWLEYKKTIWRPGTPPFVPPLSEEDGDIPF